MWGRLFLVLIITYIPFAQAADWSSCADDLDRLRRAARDASDTAREVEAKKNDLQNCVNYPSIYDLMRDRCQSARWNYESVLSNLDSQLSIVESRLRSVQRSCGFQFSLGFPEGVPKGQREDPCNTFRSYRGRLPIATLFEICKKSMTEDECKKCLDIK